MPYAFRIRPADRLVVVRLFGKVEGREILAAIREGLEHPDWERGFSTLWDLLDIETFLFVPEDLAAFDAQAGEIAALRGPGRTALVAKNPYVEINARLLGLKTSGGGERVVRLFTRVADAEAWLAH